MTSRMSLTRLVGATVLLSLPGCLDDRSHTDDASEPEVLEADDEQAEMCVELCDPVEQDCDPGESCLPDGNAFSCQDLEQDGVRLGLHEPCEPGSRVCDPGLVCLPVAVPGCVGGSACCVSYCDVNRPECSDDLSCVPFLEPGAMCHAEVGACVIG